MRYPSDCSRLAVDFAEEMHAYIKHLDADAIMIGEGASLDMPVEIFSVITNPARGIDGFGPRDYLLSLSRYGGKPLIVNNEATLFPACGATFVKLNSGLDEQNKFLVRYLREHGGPRVFTWLPGDLSMHNDLLFVPGNLSHDVVHQAIDIRSARPDVAMLREIIREDTISRNDDGAFEQVAPGIYRMQ